MKGQPRWKIAILDDHERSRAALRAAIWAAGGEVAGEAYRAGDALSLIQRTSPDVAIFAVGLPDGDGVAVAAEVTTKAACPVVLFTSHTDEALTARAREAGVMAYLLKPLRPAELAPAIDLAVARFREARELKQSLEDRKVIERAKGLLMQRRGLAESAAYAQLRQTAMDRGLKLHEVAQRVLDVADLLG